MQFQPLHGSLAGTWILGAGLIGLLANVTSIGGAAMVLGLGLMPPMLLMLRWNRPIPVRVATALADDRGAWTLPSDRPGGQ